ncbi:MAG: hypothetical protein FJ264_03830 [Planctomycetes bacterium]|nr:hypothetical protein [Planctomycetota bacterium]
MRGINHPRYDTYCMVAPILYGRLYFDLQKIGNAPVFNCFPTGADAHPLLKVAEDLINCKFLFTPCFPGTIVKKAYVSYY